MKPLQHKEPEMPLRPSRVAKAAVVGAAVTPGPSPIAKAAVVTAAVTPGRRRF